MWNKIDSVLVEIMNDLDHLAYLWDHIPEFWLRWGTALVILIYLRNGRR